MLWSLDVANPSNNADDDMERVYFLRKASATLKSVLTWASFLLLLIVVVIVALKLHLMGLNQDQSSTMLGTV